MGMHISEMARAAFTISSGVLIRTTSECKWILFTRTQSKRFNMEMSINSKTWGQVCLMEQDLN